MRACGKISEWRKENGFRDEPCELPKWHRGSHRANGVRWAAVREFPEFLKFFFLQFLVYGVFCWNSRAIATGRLGHLFVSDLIYAFMAFTLVKMIVEARTWQAKLGYTLGGAFGSVLSVWVTKQLWGG